MSNYLQATANHVLQAHQCMPNPYLTLQWHDPQINLSTGKIDNKINQVLKEVKHWESMLNRRKPLTIDMVLYQLLQDQDGQPHSEITAMYDWRKLSYQMGSERWN
jgi:hypothetical protein